MMTSSKVFSMSRKQLLLTQQTFWYWQFRPVRKNCFQLGPMIHWKPVYRYISNDFASPRPILKLSILHKFHSFLVYPADFHLNCAPLENLKIWLWKRFFLKIPITFWPKMPFWEELLPKFIGILKQKNFEHQIIILFISAQFKQKSARSFRNLWRLCPYKNVQNWVRTCKFAGIIRVDWLPM